jgi:ABC-type cobalt transport system substrate-binding protein
MKYKIAVAGLLLFLFGFILASRAYDFICSCKAPTTPINELDPCYQCLFSSKYQNYLLLFQVIMTVSIFVVLYGFFSEFEYGTSTNHAGK